MNSLLRVTSNHSRLLFSLSSSPLSSISASLPDFNFYSSNRLIVSSTKNRSLPLVISTRHMSTENFFIQVHTSMINSKPVLAFQEALVQIHAYTGLPWAVEIVACGLILRTALFPLAIYERKQQAKYENLGPQLEQHMFGVNEQLKVKMAKQELTRSEAKKRFQKAVFLKRRQLILDHNLHPFKRVIVVLFQIPIWVTMSCALGNLCLRSPYIEQPRIRTLATEAAPQLQTEGLLWFQDLTLADPTYILPIVFGSLFMANVLYADLLRKQNEIESPAIAKAFSIFLKFFAFFVIYASHSVPVALPLYWSSSFLAGLTQNILFSYPQFRRLCTIPRTTREMRPIKWSCLINKRNNMK